MAKAIHIGLRAGAGPPPGYMWSVCYLTAARDDAMGFLNDAQYGHVTDLMEALASELDPRRPKTVSVDQVEDFHELKDKGGILGKINLRVFFIVEDGEKTVLVVAAIKKESEGQTPDWAKTRARSRIRRFRAGDYGALPIGNG